MTLADKIAAAAVATLEKNATRMAAFTGPLGGHRSYLTHVALPNCFEYLSIQKEHTETCDSSIHAKYQEFRRFLNTIESLNNALEYAYYELRPDGTSFSKFRDAAWGRYPEIRRLADLANSYKHCVRSEGSKMRPERTSARDLQRQRLNVTITANESERKVDVKVDYDFVGPLPEHVEIFHSALQFWFKYHNNPASNDLAGLICAQSG